MSAQAREASPINVTAWNKIIARAWVDADFHTRFKTDPISVFKEYGMRPLDNNLDQAGLEELARSFELPPRPAELDDESLDQVAAGIMCGGCSCCTY